MAGKTDIANLALTDIGANMISGFPADGDDTNEASKVDAFWELLVDEVLAKINWDFAKKASILAEDADYDIEDAKWDYAYSLPADCVKPRYLSDRDYNYEIRGLHLLCDLEDGDAILLYTARIEDTTKWDALFTMAFAKRLSAALCRPLKKKESRAKELLVEYREKIAEATQGDAAQANMTNDDQYRHTADNDTWLSARST